MKEAEALPAALGAPLPLQGTVTEQAASVTPNLEIHLQAVQPADVAVDRVDDLALVDEHVVELDGAGWRAGRCRRHEGADLLRLVRVGDVEGAQTTVEEGA